MAMCLDPHGMDGRWRERGRGARLRKFVRLSQITATYRCAKSRVSTSRGWGYSIIIIIIIIIIYSLAYPSYLDKFSRFSPPPA